MDRHGWYFPDNGDGQEEGFSSQGLTEFKKDHFKHLAREVCQNSIDAKSIENDKAVVVKFNELSILRSEVPQIDQLSKHLHACINYSDEEDEKKMFLKASEALKRRKIRLLKISDFGTTGLDGIGEAKSSWNALVNSIGKSKKGKGAGGSYGLGKNAPFVVSDMNTVFYSTLNEQGEYGFQGVSKLMAHEYEGVLTRATGYYYDTAQKLPIMATKDVSEVFRREDIGTDIFSLGFINRKSWKSDIIKAVIENFFISIIEGKLEVYVDEIQISNDTVDKLIPQYFSNSKNVQKNFYQYYDTYINGEKHELKILDKGTADFYLLEGKNYSRKVAMFRSTGMKIKEQGRFPKELSYAGIFITKDDDMNELLRKMEPPTHTDWSIDYLNDKSKADEGKAVLAEIDNQIKKIINDLVLKNIDESTILSLNGLLPDLSEQETIYSKYNDKIAPNKNKVDYTTSNDPYDFLMKRRSKVGQKMEKRKKRKKIVESDDNNTRKRTKKNSKDTDIEKKYIDLSFSKVRSFSNPDVGTYTLFLQTENTGEGYFEVSLIGTGNRKYEEQISSVLEISSGKRVDVLKKNIIGPVYFEENQKKEFEIVIPGYSNYSLGVEAYEI